MYLGSWKFKILVTILIFKIIVFEIKHYSIHRINDGKFELKELFKTNEQYTAQMAKYCVVKIWAWIFNANLHVRH